MEKQLQSIQELLELVEKEARKRIEAETMKKEKARGRSGHYRDVKNEIRD
jgi:hypothetical protein